MFTAFAEQPITMEATCNCHQRGNKNHGEISHTQIYYKRKGPFSRSPVLLFAVKVAGENILLQSGVTVISLAASLALCFLELLVAFLQAYVFTFLTALFMGMATHEGHAHEEHAHDEHGHDQKAIQGNH